MLRHRDSMDSFSNMSIGDVSGVLNEKTLNEKADPEMEDFYPTMSYGALSIPDVDGALADKKDNNLSSASSQTLSSASSITYPTPARIRENSCPDSIEISSAHRDSSYIEPIIPPVVSIPQPQPQVTEQPPAEHVVAWYSQQ